MLSMVKMPLKRAVGDRALNSHGNNIVDHGKSWKNHGIVFLNFCGNPVKFIIRIDLYRTFKVGNMVYYNMQSIQLLSAIS